MTTIRFIYNNLWREGEIGAPSSEQAQFPADNTQDDCKALVWKSDGIDDTEKVTDGGLENWASATNLTSWTESIAGTSTINQESVEIHGGTYSCRGDVDASNSGCGIYQSLTLAASGIYTITVWHKVPVDKSIYFYLKALASADYLKTDGTWAAGATSYQWVMNGTGEWTKYSMTFVSHSVDTVILLLISKGTMTSASFYIDDISVVPAEYIDCDFGVDSEFDTVALLNHNLTSDAVITVFSADDATFATNLVSDTLTHNGNNLFEFLAAARTKRYCRIAVHDPDNPSAYIQIGVIVVGKYFAPNRNFGKYSEGEVDETEMEKSASMNLFTVQERPRLVTWELPFSGLDATSIAAVKAMRLNNGVSKALVFCTDTTAPNSNSYWAHFPELSATEFATMIYGIWSANLEEVL